MNQKRWELIERDVVELQKSCKIEGTLTDRLVHLVHIKAWQLQQKKTDILMKKLCERKKRGEENEFFYMIPSYLAEICGKLAALLSGLTNVEQEDILVNILYRMGEKGTWKRIQNNENISGEISGIKWFLDRQDPVVKKVLDHELPWFYSSGREGGERALFCKNLDLKSEEKRKIAVCLVVSAPGGCYKELERQCMDSQRVFEQILADLMLPYFSCVIQSELEMMLLWKKKVSLKSMNQTEEE